MKYDDHIPERYSEPSRAFSQIRGGTNQKPLVDRFRLWAFDVAYYRSLSTVSNPCQRFALAIAISSQPVSRGTMEAWDATIREIKGVPERSRMAAMRMKIIEHFGIDHEIGDAGRRGFEEELTAVPAAKEQK